MKTIEEMEEVNIYSDVSGQRPRPPSPVKKKHLALWTSFSIQALVFIGLARRFYIYLQIYNK